MGISSRNERCSPESKPQTEQAENPQKRVGALPLPDKNFYIMKIRNSSIALTLFVLFLHLVSCKKEAIPDPITPVEPLPTIPSGNRIIIHFGTSTQQGCMYSFSNCIWIGWGASLTDFADRTMLQFEEGDKAQDYFGDYFPLTADFTTEGGNGTAPHTIPAGFYPLYDTPLGKAVVFSAETGQQVAPLVNAGNPQDNLGQLHNLAVQVILNKPENQEKIRQITGDKAAIQAFAIEQVAQFLEESDLQVSTAELQRAKGLDLFRTYTDYTTQVDAMRLSARDKKAVLDVFNKVSQMQVSSPEQLSQFVSVMTGLENGLATSASLDDAPRVLSVVSILKYSRYYWYWTGLSHGGTGNPTPASIPNWVWADAIGMELGGPLVSAAASIAVYLDER